MKKRLSLFLLLFILLLSTSELYSQSFEGQIILQNGGELWEGMIPPPVFIYRVMAPDKKHSLLKMWHS